MIEPPVVVRPADPAADALGLARLRWDWRVGRGESPRSDRATFEREFATWLACHHDTHVGFVAENDRGLPVGMAWFGILERVPGPEHWTRLSASIQSVYVDPAMRGQGVGRALVSAAIEAARARGIEYLGVHPTERSVSMYRRLGFTERDRALELDLGSEAASNPLA